MLDVCLSDPLGLRGASRGWQKDDGRGPAGGVRAGGGAASAQQQTMPQEDAMSLSMYLIHKDSWIDRRKPADSTGLCSCCGGKRGRFAAGLKAIEALRILFYSRMRQPVNRAISGFLADHVRL